MQQGEESEELVSCHWLAENLASDSMRIVEVIDGANLDVYSEGHIPGAIYWRWKESLWDDTMREFLSPEKFSRLMRKSGVGPETTLVLYSNSCQFAHYAFWVCLMRGHTKVKILHGNRTLWIKEKLPLVRSIPSIEPVDYPIRSTDESSRIGREEILAGLHKKDRVLLDVREFEEFVGERVSPSHEYMGFDHGAERKGHIPGARHLCYRNLLNDDDTFKTLDKLRTLFDEAGATRDKELVFYCRLSHRASLAWFAARFLLRYPQTKIYDGSWTEWGSIVGVPIENNTIQISSMY
ncbi:MAG: sulfurtransferase [Candidatus Bathyarchaeia archaeon]